MQQHHRHEIFSTLFIFSCHLKGERTISPGFSVRRDLPSDSKRKHKHFQTSVKMHNFLILLYAHGYEKREVKRKGTARWFEVLNQQPSLPLVQLRMQLPTSLFCQSARCLQKNTTPEGRNDGRLAAARVEKPFKTQTPECIPTFGCRQFLSQFAASSPVLALYL